MERLPQGTTSPNATSPRRSQRIAGNSVTTARAASTEHRRSHEPARVSELRGDAHSESRGAQQDAERLITSMRSENSIIERIRAFWPATPPILEKRWDQLAGTPWTPMLEAYSITVVETWIYLAGEQDAYYGIMSNGAMGIFTSQEIKAAQERLASNHSVRARGEKFHFPDEVVESISEYLSMQGVKESVANWALTYNTWNDIL